MTNKEIMYKEFAEHFSEENTKLKAEIDELKSKIVSLNYENTDLKKEVGVNILWSNVVEKTLKKEIDKNTKLCEEIAELKKSIPRICETCRYEDLMETEEPCESCNHCSSWEMKSEVK